MKNRSFVAIRDLHLIRELARSMRCVVCEQSLKRLGRYVELVAAWNSKIDLTAARHAQEQVQVLLADAMVLAEQSIVPSRARVVDIGSGAGAPAIPLVLIRDDLAVCLVEAKQRRVAFLNIVVGILGLEKSVEVLPMRIDPANARVEGQPFDVAISRAVFSPAQWLEIGAKLADKTILLTAKVEPPDPPTDLTRETGRDYRLPRNNAQRTITVYRSR